MHLCCGHKNMYGELCKLSVWACGCSDAMLYMGYMTLRRALCSQKRTRMNGDEAAQEGVRSRQKLCSSCPVSSIRLAAGSCHQTLHTATHGWLLLGVGIACMQRLAAA